MKYLDAVYRELLERYEQDLKNDKRLTRPSIRFTITTTGNICYNYESISELLEDNVLRENIINEFKIQINYYFSEARILASFDNTEKVYSSQVTIEANEQDWVVNNTQKIEDLISRWENQDSVFKKYSLPLSLAFVLVSSYIAFFIVFSALSSEPTSKKAFTTLLPTLGAFFLPSFMLSGYLKALWPDIEIVPVTEYANQLAKKEKRWSTF